LPDSPGGVGGVGWVGADALGVAPPTPLAALAVGVALTR